MDKGDKVKRLELLKKKLNKKKRKLQKFDSLAKAKEHVKRVIEEQNRAECSEHSHQQLPSPAPQNALTTPSRPRNRVRFSSNVHSPKHDGLLRRKHAHRSAALHSNVHNMEGDAARHVVKGYTHECVADAARHVVKGYTHECVADTVLDTCKGDAHDSLADATRNTEKGDAHNNVMNRKHGRDPSPITALPPLSAVSAQPGANNPLSSDCSDSQELSPSILHPAALKLESDGVSVCRSKEQQTVHNTVDTGSKMCPETLDTSLETKEQDVAFIVVDSQTQSTQSQSTQSRAQSTQSRSECTQSRSECSQPQFQTLKCNQSPPQQPAPPYNATSASYKLRLSESVLCKDSSLDNIKRTSQKPKDATTSDRSFDASYKTREQMRADLPGRASLTSPHSCENKRDCSMKLGVNESQQNAEELAVIRSDDKYEPHIHNSKVSKSTSREVKPVANERASLDTTVRKARRRRKSQRSEMHVLDFSFLEDESSDMYSQIKHRNRKCRSRSLPGSLTDHFDFPSVLAGLSQTTVTQEPAEACRTNERSSGTRITDERPHGTEKITCEESRSKDIDQKYERQTENRKEDLDERKRNIPKCEEQTVRNEIVNVQRRKHSKKRVMRNMKQDVMQNSVTSDGQTVVKCEAKTARQCITMATEPSSLDMFCSPLNSDKHGSNLLTTASDSCSHNPDPDPQNVVTFKFPVVPMERNMPQEFHLTRADFQLTKQDKESTSECEKLSDTIEPDLISERRAAPDSGPSRDNNHGPSRDSNHSRDSGPSRDSNHSVLHNTQLTCSNHSTLHGRQETYDSEPKRRLSFTNRGRKKKKTSLGRDVDIAGSTGDFSQDEALQRGGGTGSTGDLYQEGARQRGGGTGSTGDSSQEEAPQRGGGTGSTGDSYQRGGGSSAGGGTVQPHGELKCSADDRKCYGDSLADKVTPVSRDMPNPARIYELPSRIVAIDNAELVIGDERVVLVAMVTERELHVLSLDGDSLCSAQAQTGETFLDVCCVSIDNGVIVVTKATNGVAMVINSVVFGSSDVCDMFIQCVSLKKGEDEAILLTSAPSCLLVSHVSASHTLIYAHHFTPERDVAMDTAAMEGVGVVIDTVAMERVADCIHSVCTVSGLDSAVLGISSGRVHIWDRIEGVLLRSIDVHLRSHLCAIVCHQQGLLFMLLWNEDSQWYIVALNPYTSRHCVILTSQATSQHTGVVQVSCHRHLMCSLHENGSVRLCDIETAENIAIMNTTAFDNAATLRKDSLSCSTVVTRGIPTAPEKSSLTSQKNVATLCQNVQNVGRQRKNGFSKSTGCVSLIRSDLRVAIAINNQVMMYNVSDLNTAPEM